MDAHTTMTAFPPPPLTVFDTEDNGNDAILLGVASSLVKDATPGKVRLELTLPMGQSGVTTILVYAVLTTGVNTKQCANS
jgi:hypothetical protein